MNIDKKILKLDSNRYEIFNLNNKNENKNENIFVLKYGQYKPYIIDFSRAFIYKSNNIDNEIITKSLKEEYKKKIILIFKHEIRDFYKENKIYILYCINEEFDKFYKIFRAFDTYKFSNGMISLLNNIKKDIKFDENYIDNSHLNLMEKINSFSLNFIKKYIYLLYEDNNIKIPNINKEIILKFFSQYNLLNINKITED